MRIPSPSHRLPGEAGAWSDERVVAAVRAGDSTAYAVLWERHAGAARRAARAITSAFDPDDVVSESFASVLSAIQGGGGPTEAFRPYLFATIRNVAAMWGRRGRPLALDALPEHLLADGADDPFDSMSERTAIAEAFRTLPVRHRTLLWYLEVEGMKPREIAPLMGLTPNAVAALSYRAREGFRRAWLEAHIADPSRPEDCRWFCERVVLRGRRAPARGDAARYTEHLRTCRGCQIVAADVENVSSRLRGVVLPVILGGSAATAYLADPASGTAAAAVSTAPAPAGIPLTTGSADETTIGPGAAHRLLGSARPAAVALCAALTAVAVAAAGAVLLVVAAPLSDPPPRAEPAPPSSAQRAAPAEPVPAHAATPPAPAAPRPQPQQEPAPGTRPADRGEGADPPPVAAAPGTTPAPRATQPSRPRAEPPSDSGFRFTSRVDPGVAVPDILTGAGVPGAAVSVFDETGAVLLHTIVSDDGTFVADVSGEMLHQGMTIQALQTLPGAAGSERAPALGPLTFAVPELRPTGRDDTFEYVASAAGDGSADAGGGIRVRLTGLPDAWAAVTVDEESVHFVHLVGGAYEGVLAASAQASHRVRVRYVDSATGRSGLTVEHHIVVPSSG